MISLKKLTNLSIVSTVLKCPQAYPEVNNGFARDKQSLRKSAKRVYSDLNNGIQQYGKKYAA